MKQKLLLLAAVFFGLMAFMLTYHQINQEKKKIQAAVRDVDLLQATRDISENEVITEDMMKGVRTKRFASQLATSLEVPLSQKNQVIGRKAQFPIPKGNLVHWNDLQDSITAGRDGVTRMIQPGYRAIAISVDQTASVAGLVQPNNYVDLIGTFKFPDMRGDSSLDTITLTILQRVRVIAVGNDYGLRAPGQNAGPRSYGTVTLELTPREVEMVIFATQKGRVQMSLRNYEESEITDDLQSINWKFLEKNFDRYNRERKQKSASGGL